MLAYNFFFLPPLYTFTIADPENVVALFFFGVTAVIASNLTARVRAQAIAARQRGAHDRGALPVQPQARGRGEPRRPAVGTVHQIALMLKVRVVILLPEDGTVAVRAGYPPEDMLDDADLAAAQMVLGEEPRRRARVRHAARRQAAVPADAHRPRRGRRGRHRQRRAGPDAHARSARLLDALADQAALAIERVNLVEDVDRARLVAETDRLRAALLTSISHDLRTPLASILGSATSLTSYGRRSTTRPARADRAPSRTRPSGSIASSATCWT